MFVSPLSLQKARAADHSHHNIVSESTGPMNQPENLTDFQAQWAGGHVERCQDAH